MLREQVFESQPRSSSAPLSKEASWQELYSVKALEGQPILRRLTHATRLQ